MLILFSFFTSSSIANDAQIEKQVLAKFDSLVFAAKTLNTELYFQHFDDKRFVGLNSDGSNWNSLADLKPLITGGFNSIEKVVSLQFSNVKVLVIDEYTAILVNEFEQTIQLKSGDELSLRGGGTQVWSKHSGSWKLVSVSASNKP